MCWIAIASWVVLGQVSNSAPTTTPRDVHEIRREVSDLLKAESSTDDTAARSRSVRRMTEIYREVVRDERLIESPTLQQQKIKLWTRMTRVRDEIRRHLKIDARREQQTAEDTQQAAQIASHLQFTSQTLGGPAVVMEAAGGGIVMDDFGDELIDLITRTIQPDHWDENGGPGTIFYYRPLFALVVRARSEVQHSVGGVIGGLRDAGK